MGIGTQGEPRRVVAQHRGHSLHVHNVLQFHGCEGVSEVVKPAVLRADGLQDLLMGVAEGVRVEHGAGLGRHKQVGTVWVLCVFLHQQLHRPLRDGQLADTVTDMISFSLQTCVERNITVRRCKNCGRYFAQTGRVSAEYCDRTPLDGQSSCRAMGAFQQWTLKQADDPVFKVYRREYKRRFAWIKAGRISDSEFYAWSEQAREQKKKCDEGIITAEDFQRWLKES